MTNLDGVGMTAERKRQRLWGGIRGAMGEIEAYLAGLTRSQFARDSLRRDAVERSLERIAALAACLPPQDRAGFPMLSILTAIGRRAPLDRLDSDVVWSLVQGLKVRAELSMGVGQ